jgi:predicted Zn-dependent peptidase
VDIPIRTYTLANGLRITLSEDHTAPIVAVNLWYHVGSANERPGRTGFAHLFEHMLFQGSAHVGSNEHFELIQRAGGTLNGSTWLDRTNYFETIPSHHLALALWLEADRMANLLPALTEEKLNTQRAVVKNERRWSVDNRPYGTWWERLPALVFPEAHPFHHSLIGSMDDLDAATLDDVAGFFGMYYRPDNAVLTVVGDFVEESTRDTIERYFGGAERGEPKPPLASTQLPPEFGTWLRATVEDDVPAARLFLAFRIPPFGSPAWYPAAICSAILGLRRGCRLHRTLVRERGVASEVSAFTYDLTKGNDLLVLDVTGRPDVDGAVLEQEVAREVDRILRDGVTQDEVTRALTQVETDIVASLESAQLRADRLSMFATYFGEPARIRAEPARYRAVTADAVRAFAAGHLHDRNRASLLFVPAQTEA